MTSPFPGRRKKLQAKLEEDDLDSLLITHPANWYYLTGFTGEAGALVVAKTGVTLITDGRFTEQARRETSGVRILRQAGSLLGSTGEFLKKRGARRIGFNASQVTVSQLRLLRKASGARTRWIAAAGYVEALRAAKDPVELAEMRRAALLVGEVLESALKLLKPGVRELEVAAEIEYDMRTRGASGPAFESIVAFGERAAYPHARPTAKRLGKNELVVLDLGAILGHYCSDITRTVFVGRAPARIRSWYKAVLEAQAAAIATVKAGKTCGEIDAAARGTLRSYGVDKYFVHSTGHGLGLEVHEDPRVAKDQRTVLEPGNVITIEPGVYVPGTGGIRIEDDVVVQDGKAEVLTRVPRDFIEI